MNKKFIKNYVLAEAEPLFAQLGEKPFRARQLFSWIYERNISTFEEMTDFSKTLRSKLSEEFEINALTLADKQESKKDGTIKFLFETHDHHFIEAVLLVTGKEDGEDRVTICVSSQVGCAMGCTFCNTARLGFKRNLETAEILDQISLIRKIVGYNNKNVVFMGMGEPFLNYDNVIKAADIMNYSFGFHLSVRRITISTCGILPQIERYIDEKKMYNLAISLNDSIPERRAEYMPVEKKYPIEDIADLLERKTTASRNRITLEYVMRTDNISSEDARRLKSLFKGANIKLNLIPLNPGDGNYPIPSRNDVESFIKSLEIMNVPVSIRKSLGSDIDGACGQLSGKRYCNEESS
jgi:23S rRNA (adenine2503-C2)-methyltransferase